MSIPDRISATGERIRRPKLIQCLNSFSNMLTFGVGLVFLVGGCAYVSTLGPSYSLNRLSIDLIAGFQLAAGLVLVLLPSVRVCYAKRQSVQRGLVLTLTIFLVLFAVLFFVLAIFGLMAGSESSRIEASDDMFKTLRKYDQYNQKTNSYTKKINWIQSHFKCCGVNSHNDWKSLFNYRNPNMPTYFIKNNNNYQNGLPYIDDVPDSCCVVPTVNCGRQASNHGRDRSQIIYMRGCLVPYMDQYIQHTRHLAILSVTFAILFFIDAFVFLYLYQMLRRMAKTSQSTTGPAQSANNRRPTVHFDHNRRPTVHFR